MKPYLLIAGYNYYPGRGTSDWIGCFDTNEEAEEKWNLLKLTEEYPYDWWEIVDLRGWMND